MIKIDEAKIIARDDEVKAIEKTVEEFREISTYNITNLAYVTSLMDDH